MKPTIEIVVELNGGLIQCVYDRDGDGQAENRVLVIDWDREEEPDADKARWALETLLTIREHGINAPEATMRDLKKLIREAVDEF